MKLSVVVISYCMNRELPRTVFTLSAKGQLDIDEADYEIIVVDNASPEPPDEVALKAICPNLQLVCLSEPDVSPVRAINTGLALAKGDLICVMIDGARMASPRMLATALEAAAGRERPVIGTYAFHLGPTAQMTSVLQGYCQDVEDALLATVDWQSDGYCLFDISAWAGSSSRGWFTLPAETNALFLSRSHWEELGGYDERFKAKGGGLVNLDIWARLCADFQPVMLLGEATFHQFHGGVATNAKVSPYNIFHEEYVQIRGHPFVRPSAPSTLFGRPHRKCFPTIRSSMA